MPYHFQGKKLPRGMPALLIMVWITGTIFAFGLAVYGFYQNHLFALEGRPTEGRVDKKFAQTGMGRGRMQFLTYSYSVGNDSYTSIDTPVASSTWVEAQLHGEISVEYLARDPAQSRIDLPVERRTDELRPLAAFVIGGISLSIGLGYVLDKKRRRRH